MAEKDIQLKQVLQTKETNYVIKAAEGKVFIYQEFEIAPPEPEPIQTFNLYGEYE